MMAEETEAVAMNTPGGRLNVHNDSTRQRRICGSWSNEIICGHAESREEEMGNEAEDIQVLSVGVGTL